MKTTDINVGDKIYSLNNDEIEQWTVLAADVNNPGWYIISGIKPLSIHIHWKTIIYGTDHTSYFSRSKEELLDRYTKRSTYIIEKIKNNIHI